MTLIFRIRKRTEHSWTHHKEVGLEGQGKAVGQLSDELLYMDSGMVGERLDKEIYVDKEHKR